MLDMCSGNPSHVVSHENVKRLIPLTTHQTVHKALRCGVGLASLVLRHRKTFVFDILKTKAMSFEATNAFA